MKFTRKKKKSKIVFNRNHGLTFTRPKDKEQIRADQIKRQKGMCPILKLPLGKKAVLDHKHKLKSQVAGPDGRGLCRGVLHDHANAFEGKIENAYKRLGLHNYRPLPFILRTMADYIEKPPMLHMKIVHPDEKKRPPKKHFSLVDYRRICKYWDQVFPRRKKGVPPYPEKTKRLTKEWENILEKVNKVHFGE